MSDDDPVTYPEAIADAALRRAAQLQAEAAERIERQALTQAFDNRLSRDELATVARESGIADEYLTLALAEVDRPGADALALVDSTSDATLMQWLGSKRRSISVSRRFDAPAAEVLALLPDVFESPEFRLAFDGHSGGHPLQGGVLRFRMPRLAELVTTHGTYTKLCYRLEQLEFWTLQVSIHDHGAHTQVVVYGDLRRGTQANARAAKGFTVGLGALGLAGAIALGLGAGLGALVIVPALAAAAGSGSATMLGYRASYRSALAKTHEQLGLLLDAVARKLERQALTRPR